MSNAPTSRPNPGGITAESSTWVILDDTSADIEYRGNWIPITASPQMNSVGYFGPTYRDTLHSLTGQGSLTFQFQGTSVRLLGTILNKPGDVLAKVDCFMDGVKQVGTSLLADFEANNFPYCEISDLKDGQHTLNVTISVPSGHTAWIDELAYVPSPNSDLSLALLQVDDADPMIKYDSYWQDLTIARWTHSNGSQAIVEFAGTSLSWYGIWYPSDDHETLPESRASWIIDDNPDEHDIIIPTRPDSENPFYNELIFNVEDLAPTWHRLTVTYHSSSSAQPLYLDYLLIQRAPVPDLPATTTSAVPGATNTTNSGNIGSRLGDKSTSLSTGAEIGVGIGAAIAAILLTFLAILLYRRYNHEEQHHDNISILSHPPISAFYSHNHPTSRNVYSPSPASASNDLPSHPTYTRDAQRSAEPVVSAGADEVFTGGYAYDQDYLEEAQRLGHTEDPPRYSMHFAHGGQRL